MGTCALGGFALLLAAVHSTFVLFLPGRRGKLCVGVGLLHGLFGVAPAEGEAAGASGVLRDLDPAISLLVVGHPLNLFIGIQAAIRLITRQSSFKYEHPSPAHPNRAKTSLFCTSEVPLPFPMNLNRHKLANSFINKTNKKRSMSDLPTHPNAIFDRTSQEEDRRYLQWGVPSSSEQEYSQRSSHRQYSDAN